MSKSIIILLTNHRLCND